MNWKYDSDELNRRIIALCDRHDIYEAVPGAGKAIFYWGWAWRLVEFDERQYKLAVNHDGRFAGFCEVNKWNYPTFRLTIEQTFSIREALERAVSNPVASNFETVWNLMQASIPSNYASLALAIPNVT